MYLLVTYDVEAKRTEKFRKLLVKYLTHEQYSVFSGDIAEAKAIELRRALSRLMIPGDRVTEISAANRNNVAVVHLVKNESGKGEVQRITDDGRRRDFAVI
jgi:CRISPR-associated protein Cas2